MTSAKMHTDEIETSPALVRRLLRAQFPHWAELPIWRVPSAGTDNAIYRLGESMAVQLPRIYWATGQVEKEHHWLPKLAPRLPLKIPMPLAKGEPAAGYPWEWSIYQWLDGESARIELLADPCQSAVELAEFILALQRMDNEGGPLAVEHGLRGAPLRLRDANTRRAIAEMCGLIDAPAAIRVWERALAVTEWDRQPVWFHGDLLPGNLLVVDGRLSAVIDFAGLGIGDPAPDLMIAWGLLSGESREVFRKALGVDDATWTRGRAHALSQAAIFVPYYLQTNPVGVSNALQMIAAVLAEEVSGEQM